MPGVPTDPWFAFAFLGVGALFVVTGATTLVRAGQRRRQWHTYQGKVIASRLDDGQFRFQVAFDHDGREIRFWNRHTTAIGIDPVGRDVEVLANPADPSQAVVSKGQSRPEFAGVGFLVFGVLAMAIGVNMVR